MKQEMNDIRSIHIGHQLREIEVSERMNKKSIRIETWKRKEEDNGGKER